MLSEQAGARVVALEPGAQSRGAGDFRDSQEVTIYGAEPGLAMTSGAAVLGPWTRLRLPC